ncbi:MAG: tRNA epoxyqueuosine(34) reductase QueG [Rhizobiales bacterium]|nr:tRNA epoxyqueuosine(34) reductase QueG [Hyphomicrobiales bacterium]
MAGACARLARRQRADLCRPGRGRASVGGRLSGRCALDRRRNSEELVRAAEVAAVVPSAAGRDHGRHPSVKDLRRPRLLREPAALKSALAEAARAQGFDAIGVARPDSIPFAPERLRQFLAQGGHGDMDWMETTAARRGDPRALWPGVRSIIMLGMNYGPDADPLAILRQRSHGAISVYAQGIDYHEIIKPRLKAVARWLTAQASGDMPIDVKVFVDTAAVMEKPLAEQAGLGWQGKHTNLVSREFGSWLFLGAIFTTLDLPADAPETDHCGSCRACLDVCPTAAFPAPYRLDARRCISYLTIEHKGPIPRALRPLMGNRIYGCDDCLAVCPWNKYAQTGREAKLAARAALRTPGLAELARLDDAGFRALFTKSPVKRTGRDRFIRNVLIAIGNSGDASLAADAERLLDDVSPLVRGAAVWALGRLDRARLAARVSGFDGESDPAVREEWTVALEGAAA